MKTNDKKTEMPKSSTEKPMTTDKKTKETMKGENPTKRGCGCGCGDKK